MTPSPYAAPAPFISAHSRAALVKTLLLIGAGAACLSLLADVLSLAYPPIAEDQEVGDNLTGAVVLFILFLIGLLELVIYFTTVVCFLIWLYRASDNLRAINPHGPIEYSPGWAVGSFFIPIANLFIPYRAVKEIWQKSGPPDEAFLFAPSPPSTFPTWWTFWILAAIVGNISTRLSFDEGVPHGAATLMSIAASALFIVAAVFAYLVVDSIDKKQEETAVKLRLGKFSGPPPAPPSPLMPDMSMPDAAGTPGPSNPQQQS